MKSNKMVLWICRMCGIYNLEDIDWFKDDRPGAIICVVCGAKGTIYAT